MSEIWKVIPQFPNYEANEWSHIRNKKTKRILRPNRQQQVKLHQNGKPYARYVYHLSLLAFFPDIPPQETVDHIIEKDTTNNHISNLRWLSQRDNSRKSNFVNPRRPGITATRHIQQWSADGQTMINEFPSIRHASEKTGFSETNITTCIRGKTKTAGGFKWCYKPDPDLPGEIWATSDALQALLKRARMTESRRERIRISNLGRAQAVNGRRTFGNIDYKHKMYRKFAGLRMHKLVWATFGARPPGVTAEGKKEVICHNDSLPLDADGCVSNAIHHLRLGTQSDNMKESYAVGKLSQLRKRKYGEI